MKKVAVFIVAVVAILSGAIPCSVAQTTSEMYVCVSSKTGAMRYVGTAPTSCGRGETLVSWNQTSGPQGGVDWTQIYSVKATSGASHVECNGTDIAVACQYTCFAGWIPPEGPWYADAVEYYLFAPTGWNWQTGGTRPYSDEAPGSCNVLCAVINGQSNPSGYSPKSPQNLWISCVPRPQ